MGIHHFTLYLVPRSFYERMDLPVPTTITEEDVERGESVDAGWWSPLQPTEQTLTRLRNLCPTKKSWGETEEFVTSEKWGSDLRIWKEHGRVWLVTFRFSPAADDHVLLDQFVAIARDEHCLLLDAETGSLFEPDDQMVAERLHASRAIRFVRDPQNTILESTRKAAP
jgi:hypothetical protein